ncbi:MAG: hypothetical protein K8F59_16085 [Rhodobacteraceae bacterium]|nr:hypothetical protein [Paracoccaceae bacterium]
MRIVEIQGSFKYVARNRRCRYPQFMTSNEEKRIAANLAKTMALLCVRNHKLENIHADKVPAIKTGDWSDVTVVDANGDRIPWTEVSHIV